jgi:hypothetical protein
LPDIIKGRTKVVSALERNHDADKKSSRFG